jgi:hypothetical protein
MNNSTVCEVQMSIGGGRDSSSLCVQLLAGVTLVGMIVLAVGGNALTIAAYFRDRQLQSVYNLYIVNLAVADLSIACVSMPFYVIYTFNAFNWPFGRAFCKIYLVNDFTHCLESVLLIMLLSLDRLLLLKHGPHYTHKETKKAAKIKICVSWVIAFLMYGPAIIGWDYWVGETSLEEGECDVEFDSNVAYTTTTAVCEFFIPFVMIGIINILVVFEIRKKNRTHPKHVVLQGHVLAASGSAPVTPTTAMSGNHIFSGVIGRNVTDVRQQPTVRAAIRRDIKAAKYLAALVIVFGVTWAPYTIATVLLSFCEECVNDQIWEFFSWVLWFKSAINPFLYAYNSDRIRCHYKRCFRCMCPSSYANGGKRPSDTRAQFSHLDQPEM